MRFVLCDGCSLYKYNKELKIFTRGDTSLKNKITALATGEGVLNAKTNNDFNQYMPKKINRTLNFEPITVDTVNRIINGLKPRTSTGVYSV